MTKKVVLKAAYDEFDAESLRTGTFCPEPTLAQQQFKDEADINEIVRRFGITGHMPENPRVPTYGDFSGITDFRSALEAISEAEEAFMEFPAEVRRRFENDPQQLLEFVADDRNRDEALKLGLLKVPEVVQAPPATPPA